MIKVAILSNQDMTSNIIFSNLFKKSEIRLVGVAFTTTLTRKRTGILGVFDILQRLNFIYWLFLVFSNGIFVARASLAKILPFSVSIKSQCARHRVPVTKSSNFNSTEFIKWIKRCDPDIIIIRVDQMLGRELLSVPPKGVWCIHSSLLPAYRGIAGEFHAMARKEALIGTSLFEVRLKLDAGKVLRQASFKPTNDLLYNILKNNSIAAHLLEKALTDVANKRPSQDGSALDNISPSYHSWPKSSDMTLFNQTGAKLLGLKGFCRFINLILS